MREMGRQALPIGVDHLPQGIQLHFTVDDGTEEALSLTGAEGDEIGTGSGVIVFLQPN